MKFNHSIKLFFSRNAFHMVTHFQKSNFFHFLKLSVKTYEPSNLSENLSKHQLMTAKSELVEIDRKRLVFKVEAFDERGMIGEGTHERFVIDNEKFQEKANNK